MFGIFTERLIVFHVMIIPPSCLGGIFSPQLPDRRASATIAVTSNEIIAGLADGSQHHMPLDHTLRLEVGGASGRMVMCRHGDVMIYSEDPHFLGLLQACDEPHVRSQLTCLEANKKRHRRMMGLIWTSVLATLFVLAGLAWWSAKRALHLAITHMPYTVDVMLEKSAMGSVNAVSAEQYPKTMALLNSLLKQLKPESKDKAIQYKIALVDSAEINAFALPGGQVVVFTGLLRDMTSPEQLAATLAHEVSHVDLRHGTERLLLSMGAFTAARILLGDISAGADVVGSLVTSGAMNNYSQKQEDEADEEGFKHLIKAKIDPKGFISLFDIFDKAMKEHHLDKIPEWLGTHPEPKSRIEHVQSLIKALPKDMAYHPIDVDFAAVKLEVSRCRGDGGTACQREEKQ